MDAPAEFTGGCTDAPIVTPAAPTTVLAAPITGVASATLGPAAAVFPVIARVAIMGRTGTD